MNTNKENIKKPSKEAELISRKDSLRKMGKYAALTAMGTFILLNPRKAQAHSEPPRPGDW